MPEHPRPERVTHASLPLNWAGEFVDQGWEERFQQHAWPHNARILRVSSLWGALLYFLCFIPDYFALGWGRPFLVCLAARAVAMLSALPPWVYARRAEFTRASFWAGFFMEVVIAITIAVVATQKTAHPGNLPLAAIMLVAIFILLPPIKLQFQLAGGIIASVVFLVAFGLTNRAADAHVIWVTGLMLALDLMLCSIVAMRNNVMRRRSFEHLRLLEDAESKHRLVVENAVEGIVVMGPSAVLYANPWVERVTGHDRAEIIGRPFTDFVYQDDRDGVFGSHSRRMTEGRTTGVKRFRVSDRDGRLTWLEASGVFIHWAGQQAALYFLTDITSRLVAEEQERLNQKVEAAIQTAGAACHELNQPLQTVLMQAELIMLAMDHDHPLHGRMSKIAEAANQMARVTQRLNRITSFHTKVYVGRELILDLDRSTGDDQTARQAQRQHLQRDDRQS